MFAVRVSQRADVLVAKKRGCARKMLTRRRRDARRERLIISATQDFVQEAETRKVYGGNAGNCGKKSEGEATLIFLKKATLTGRVVTLGRRRYFGGGKVPSVSQGGTPGRGEYGCDLIDRFSRPA